LLQGRNIFLGSAQPTFGILELARDVLKALLIASLRINCCSRGPQFVEKSFQTGKVLCKTVVSTFDGYAFCSQAALDCLFERLVPSDADDAQKSAE